jgi:asparagine synthase (glutamine-hydrolysing)
MSVQFGRWNFGGVGLDSSHIEKASALIAPYGPDGERRYSDKDVTVLYRGFHTTAESRFEQQPQVSGAGFALTWDGRLDNRDDLVRLLKGVLGCDSPDVSIVAAAYERWGTDCFAKLVGDWAASVWDSRRHELLLAKDFLGTRHLYYATNADSVSWCTVLDPLVLLARRPIRLNEAYLAGWLSSSPASDQTPYLGIDAVPPACFVRLGPGKCEVCKYWKFDPGRRIRYRSDGEYEEHFREALSQSVRRRLRCDSPVLAELSGGMDSSSIVCLADFILEPGEAQAPELDTVSYFNDQEPNWNERPFVAVVEKQRRKTGCHIDAGAQKLLTYELANQGFIATPGDICQESDAARQFANCLNSRSYQVLLSGIGGDEVTGGVPSPLPELADYLARGHFMTLGRMLKTWALQQRRPWFQLLGEVLREFLPSALIALPKQRQLAPWLARSFVSDHHAAMMAPRQRLRFFGPLPSFHDNMRTLEDLRRQIARLAAVDEPLYEVRYPYLDRDLLEFLFAIPPDQLVRPSQRRSLMRRALVGIVPDEILSRKRKAAVVRTPFVALSKESEDLIQMSRNLASASLGIVDADAFRKALELPRNDQAISIISLIRTIGVEMWLRHLISQQLLEPGNRDVCSQFTHESISPPRRGDQPILS